MKTIAIESSVLEQDKPTGVNYFSQGVASGLEAVKGNDIEIRYFWLNFLLRKPIKSPYIKKAAKHGLVQMLPLIPQRVYAKLVYANIAPPLPVKKSDWQLFPNFYIWPTLSRAKKAVMIHDICFLKSPQYVEDKNRAFLDRVAVRAFKKADMIISNSQFTTNELVSHAGVNANKIVTIDIPVEAETFLPQLNKGFKHLTKRYSIVKPYILSLGTLEPRKNLATLVKAYCELPQSIRDKYSLVLAGKWGWKTESLKALIDTKRSEGYDIVTTGHIDRDDKCTFFRNASFFGITTHYEGFGMPLLEALHCGIPTVAVDIPVLREVGGESCLWTEKNVKSVRDGLVTLISSPELQDKYRKLGPKQSSRFSWVKTATVLKNAFISR